MGGHRSMWHTLKLSGIQVPRDVMERIVRELDPEGRAEWKAKAFKEKTLCII